MEVVATWKRPFAASYRRLGAAQEVRGRLHREPGQRGRPLASLQAGSRRRARCRQAARRTYWLVPCDRARPLVAPSWEEVHHEEQQGRRCTIKEQQGMRFVVDAWTAGGFRAGFLHIETEIQKFLGQ